MPGADDGSGGGGGSGVGEGAVVVFGGEVASPSTRSVVHAAAPIAMRKSVREAAVVANEKRIKITGDGTKRPQKRRKVGAVFRSLLQQLRRFAARSLA